MKKITINKDWGGYHLPKKFCTMYNCAEDAYINRTDELLISFIEDMPQFAESLGIVEIPDEASDWMIIDYDGIETVFFVIDGKIKSA